MSAWDITGVFVWGVFGALFVHDLVTGRLTPKSKDAAETFLFGIGCLAGVIFCIARLCGAHI
jgi:hypothetical protein